MKQKRVKRSEARWRELFARQAASGVTVAEFCRAEGVNAGLFRRWRSMLAPQSRRPVQGGHKLQVAKAPPAPFIDLGGLRSDSGRFEVRLELGGGMVLSIGRG
jgi:transposase-like protein